MQSFYYLNNELYVENVPLQAVAKQFGTPCYVYSRAALEYNWKEFHQVLQKRAHRICYAVKANSNIAILQLLASLGAGFDIVSLGELQRVLVAGGDPRKIVFSGVGKKRYEIQKALEANIYCINVESIEELICINEIAQSLGKVASIALRVNPNIDAQTHPYIATGLKENKFGIEFEKILSLSDTLRTFPFLKLIGIGCHIGSQLTELSPFQEAATRLIELYHALQKKGVQLEHINIGGGLGVTYQQETPPSISRYVEAICKQFSSLPIEIILEPGRAIIANTAILLTRIEYTKQTTHKNFAIVDAGMNDFLRPALYQAWHDIIPVTQNAQIPANLYDIVGPVCETADFLGKDRHLAIAPQDLLALTCAGAYGASMSSNYNSRPKVAEIMVDKETLHIIRHRESLENLFALERTFLNK